MNIDYTSDTLRDMNEKWQEYDRESGHVALIGEFVPRGSLCRSGKVPDL